MINSLIRPFFKTRVVASVLSLAGFWICLARVDRPEVASRQFLEMEKIPSVAVAPVASTERRPTPANPVDQPKVPEPVVVVDPGHGGADGGMVRNGLIEKDWTLKVGVALAGELRRRGHRVELTRDTDTTVPLEARPLLVNASPRIALLSIHFNAGTADASGVETWYSWPKKPEVMARLHNAEGILVAGMTPDDGQRLALAVQKAVTGRTGARDRGIKNREDLAMTSRTVCPAVLVECGFLSNGSESRKIQDAAYRMKLVLGLADGYEMWLKERNTGHTGPVLSTTPTETQNVLQRGTPALGDAEH